MIGAGLAPWGTTNRHPVALVLGAVAVVVGAVGVGATLGARRSRRRSVVLGGVTGGVALLVVGAPIAALVVHARSVGPGGDRPLVELDGDVDLAWADGDDLFGLSGRGVVAIARDGTVRDGDAYGRPRAVVARGRAVAISADGPRVVVADRDADLVWEATFDVDNGPADLVEVVAVGLDAGAVVEACTEDAARCDLIGVDASGRERWRQDAGDTYTGDGPLVLDAGSISYPIREVPGRLVVTPAEEGSTGTAEEVDLATGERTPIGAGGVVGVDGDVVTIARATDEGCEIAVLRGTDDEEAFEVPCPEHGFGRAAPLGDTLLQLGLDEVLLDLTTGEVVALEGRGVVYAAGEGTVVEDARGVRGLRLVRPLDGGTVARFGPDWRLESSGRHGVVLSRVRESENPFVPAELLEVIVVDQVTGEVCARMRLDTRSLSSASPLPGCRAVLTPSDGPAVLVG